jgi:DNA polymerase III subunit beta
MFVSLKQKDFQQALSIGNQISLKRSDIEAFCECKIEVSENTVVFSCISPSLYYSTKLTPTNLDMEDTKTAFLVKTDILTNTINLISDEIVSLDIDIQKSTLVVQGSTSKHTLRISTKDVNNFDLPQTSDDKLIGNIRVIAGDLIELNKIANVAVALPKNVYQPEFLSVCYSLKPADGKLCIASTDRYRIVKSTLVAQYDSIKDELKDTTTNFLLNPKNLLLLSSCVEAIDAIDLRFEEDFAHILFKDSKLVMRYGEGKYPDYEKIIPETFACSFLVNTKEITNALRQVYLFAKSNAVNKSVNITLSPEDGKMNLSAKTTDGYASESSVYIENYDGVEGEWSQSFNADYLLDYLATVQSDKILWESNPGKPSVLSPESQKSSKLYLVSGLK